MSAMAVLGRGWCLGEDVRGGTNAVRAARRRPAGANLGGVESTESRSNIRVVVALSRCYFRHAALDAERQQAAGDAAVPMARRAGWGSAGERWRIEGSGAA